jgi:AraC family transcriptional regulator
MPQRRLATISQAMSRAGAPCLSTISSEHLGASGFYVEENALSAAEIPEVISSRASAGMVVSRQSLQWNWRQAGRDYQTVFHPENIMTSPGGQFPPQWWIEPVSILTIYFEPEFLAHASPNGDPGRTVELRLSPTGTDPVIAHLFWALHHELRADWPSGRISVEGIATALGARLSLRFSTGVHAFTRRRGGLSRKALTTVIEYIRDNPGDELSLSELARLAALSQFHFCREFKRSTGKTVHEYVLDVRIERAKHLLAFSDLSIPEIAYRSGVPNVIHFSTVFRKIVGVSPAVFRVQISGTV